jgi:glycerol kinase
VLAAGRGPVAAVGITNQRETALAWDRSSGRPLGRAIVWQDRRTAGRTAALEEAGHLPVIRRKTGLVLDSYFSASKWEWLLTEGGVESSAGLALGTVDSWIVYNLTGGAGRGVVVTDVTNASRTLVLDIVELQWDPELLELFGLPGGAMAEVRPSSGRLGTTADPIGQLPAGIPISGVAGDQQAALFGQACFSPGMTKNTYGTGSFVLMNVGTTCPEPSPALLTTIAWDIGDGPVYALEGSVFVTGAAIQWLRDGLGIITQAAEAGPLADSISDTEGVYFVPALAGMGSPYWDPDARGTIIGLSRGSGRAHLARAAVEAMAFQTRDVVDAMRSASGEAIDSMRVDGGASVMDGLLRFQADLLQAPVARAAVVDTTALGAAWLAGLAEGVWGSTEELAGLWRADTRFEPTLDVQAADARLAGWHRAVERARGWALR